MFSIRAPEPMPRAAEPETTSVSPSKHNEARNTYLAAAFGAAVAPSALAVAHVLGASGNVKIAAFVLANLVCLPMQSKKWPVIGGYALGTLGGLGCATIADVVPPLPGIASAVIGVVIGAGFALLTKETSNRANISALRCFGAMAAGAVVGNAALFQTSVFDELKKPKIEKSIEIWLKAPATCGLKIGPVEADGRQYVTIKNPKCVLK